MHISGQIVEAQVSYKNSFLAIQTAQALIDVKLRNCELLLTEYIYSRQKSGNEISASLKQISEAALPYGH